MCTVCLAVSTASRKTEQCSGAVVLSKVQALAWHGFTHCLAAPCVQLCDYMIVRLLSWVRSYSLCVPANTVSTQLVASPVSVCLTVPVCVDTQWVCRVGLVVVWCACALASTTPRVYACRTAFPADHAGCCCFCACKMAQRIPHAAHTLVLQCDLNIAVWAASLPHIAETADMQSRAWLHTGLYMCTGFPGDAWGMQRCNGAVSHAPLPHGLKASARECRPELCILLRVCVPHAGVCVFHILGFYCESGRVQGKACLTGFRVHGRAVTKGFKAGLGYFRRVHGRAGPQGVRAGLCLRVQSRVGWPLQTMPGHSL